MYQTTIVSVCGSMATDIRGSTLMVAGSAPVLPGKLVWTDGRIIYGNMEVSGGCTPPVFSSGEEGYLFFTGRTIYVISSEFNEAYPIDDELGLGGLAYLVCSDNMAYANIGGDVYNLVTGELLGHECDWVDRFKELCQDYIIDDEGSLLSIKMGAYRYNQSGINTNDYINMFWTNAMKYDVKYKLDTINPSGGSGSYDVPITIYKNLEEIESRSMSELHDGFACIFGGETVSVYNHTVDAIIHADGNCYYGIQHNYYYASVTDPPKNKDGSDGVDADGWWSYGVEQERVGRWNSYDGSYVPSFHVKAAGNRRYEPDVYEEHTTTTREPYGAAWKVTSTTTVDFKVDLEALPPLAKVLGGEIETERMTHTYTSYHEYKVGVVGLGAVELECFEEQEESFSWISEFEVSRYLTYGQQDYHIDLGNHIVTVTYENGIPVGSIDGIDYAFDYRTYTVMSVYDIEDGGHIIIYLRNISGGKDKNYVYTYTMFGLYRDGEFRNLMSSISDYIPSQFHAGYFTNVALIRNNLRSIFAERSNS